MPGDVRVGAAHDGGQGDHSGHDCAEHLLAAQVAGPLVSSVAMGAARTNPRRDTDDQRFEALLTRADRGRLGFDDLRELSHLYRTQSGRLSMLRSRGDDPETVRYLNALCLRAHGHVHAPPTRLRVHGGFWFRELPAALARTLPHQCAAALLLLFGAVIGSALVLADADNLAVAVPGGMYDPTALRHLHDSPEAQRAFLARRDESFANHTLFAGGLFAHNSRIGMLSFAVGVLAALPTVLLLIYNGLTLGGFAVIFMRGELRADFAAWLVPHAIPELLAIVLCSAGGLAMGLAMVAPGRLGRATALRVAARDAFQLLVASFPLFVIAAFIESFIRESTRSTGFRFGLSAASVLALFGYVLLVRALSRRAAPVDVSFLNA